MCGFCGFSCKPRRYAPDDSDPDQADYDYECDESLESHEGSLLTGSAGM